MAKPPTEKTTREKGEQYGTLCPLLEAMYREFSELSKKKQDGQVGKTKAKMVNRLLEAIHKILESEPNFMFLDRLDEDDLPQYSDVVLILGQTKAAMQAFKEKYWYYTGLEWRWFT